MSITTERGVLEANRLILCHFDSYSTALLFARWPDGSLLSPAPLPASAAVMTPPAEVGDLHAGEPVMDAGVALLGLDAAELVYAGDFDAWMTSDEGAIRIHLLRFTTFEAPTHRIEAGGGVFRPISALRGANPQELLLLRKVFDLIMGGGGH
jgi:hypothetical protein